MMAQYLQEDGANYRIITPYDAQRSTIEADMKEVGLHWQDKCFNVDSFQGTVQVLQKLTDTHNSCRQ